MYSPRQKRAIYVLAAMSTVFALTVTYLETHRPSNDLPCYHTLPAFSLTSQDGQTVTLDDLKGKVWLADFVYTTCPGPCPLITAHMSRLQQKLPAGADVRLVSFSTDPANDTPAVLKAYSKKFSAGGEWTFLTGPPSQVYDLINHGFLLAAGAAPGQPIIHSTRLALVDKTGNIRAYYDGTTADSDARIIDDMKRLLAQKP